MTPTIVASDGRVVLVTGSPGGRTIINTVLLRRAQRHSSSSMPLRDAVDAPRLHHQWLPDRLQLESAYVAHFPSIVHPLRTRGHAVVDPRPRQGDAHTIHVAPDGTQTGVADRRRSGGAAAVK